MPSSIEMEHKMIKNGLAIFNLLLVLTLIFKGHALSGEQQSSRIAPDQIQYKPLRFDLPHPERVVLENGIVLYILENHELPLVHIKALIKTGTLYDPPGKEGTAELTAYVMRTGGTATLSSTEVDRQFDFLAASASVSMFLESAQINFSVLNNHIDQGFDLLSQIIIQPAFEQDKLDLALQLKHEEIRRLRDEPQALAIREFNRLIYQNDPRGRFPSHQSLGKIKHDDLVEFHQRFFQPNNAMFAVSGDITKADAIKYFKKYFSRWQPGTPFAEAHKPAGKTNAGVYLIHKEIPQSSVISGLYTVGKNHPDFYAFTLLDFILGSGGFPSRLVNVIRNNEGLAYSAGSFYRARPDYGIFAGYAFTKTFSTLKALSLMDSEIDRATHHTITESELNWAKKSIINGFIFSFSTPEQIVWQQMNIEYERLPADFLSTYREKIEKVSLDDLNQAAVRYLHNREKVVLILGDRKNLDQTAPPKALIIITPEDE